MTRGSHIKKNILLFCALMLLSSCGLLVETIVVYPIESVIRRYRDNKIIEEINSECLKREGIGCLVLEGYANGITANKESLFIANTRRVVRFDLKEKKAAVLAGSSDWKLFQEPRDGVGGKAVFGRLGRIALVKDKLYLRERSNPYLRMVDIASGQTTACRTAPEKILRSTKSIASDGDNLYLIDNENKRIVEIDISSGKITHVPVSDGNMPVEIDSLAKEGGFIYFTAYGSGACRLIRLDPNNGKTRSILRRYGIKILYANASRTRKPIPEKGNTLIIIAVGMDESLRFRIFDKDGKMILDKPEKDLKNRTAEIASLKRQLAEANSRSKYAENMDEELINGVKLVTGFPRDNNPLEAECPPEHGNRVMRALSYIAGDGENIYFNDECLNILRFNIKTGNLDLLARKPESIYKISGMTTSGKHFYILDGFRYADKRLIRRIDLKSGQASYLTGVLENQN